MLNSWAHRRQDGLVVSKMFFMLQISNIIHVKEKTESTKREWIGANRETGWSRFLKRLRI